MDKELLDPSNPEVQELFQNIQGNILKGHGRSYSHFIFISFDPHHAKEARSWLQKFSKENVTSAAKQKEQAHHFKKLLKEHPELKALSENQEVIRPLAPSVDSDTQKAGAPPQSSSSSHTTVPAVKHDSNLFVTVLLSAKGYEQLRIPEAHRPDDLFFRSGMKDHEHKLKEKAVPASVVGHEIFNELFFRTINPLNDPPVKDWDSFYSYEDEKRQIGAVLMFAAGALYGRSEFNKFIQHKIEEIRGVNGLIYLGDEEGIVIRNEKYQVIEHFGHPDGVSQPLFLTSDVEEYERQQNITNHSTQVSKGSEHRASWKLVLTPDNLGNVVAPTSHKYNYGSYVVYRKLAQDVTGYKKRVKELAAHRECTPEQADAMVMGRHLDGRALATPKTVPTDSNVIYNNFDFADVNVSSCPFAAHIRKTNPRHPRFRIPLPGEPTFPTLYEGTRRIARRGVSYEYRNPTNNHVDEVGLLFVACNASFASQYIYMQQQWCNELNFENPGTGVDAVVGQRQGARFELPQKFETFGNEKTKDKGFLFSDFVQMRGGEFFFQPSLPTLLSITEAPIQ